MQDAARADRTGADVGAILNGAAADTATLAAYTDTPAGQRALIAALRDRLTHQQQVVLADKRRDAALAAILRSMAIGESLGYFRNTLCSGWFYLSGIQYRDDSSVVGGALGRRGGDRPAPRVIRTPAGLAGRSSRRFLPSGPGGEAAAAALSQRGKPYVWGAKGPNRFDCSGLTQWAWAHAGVRLGPDTYSQVEQGVPVAPGQVRAGDLIFPKCSFDDRGPGHVQLAISPTEVVHAPQSGDVVRIAPMPGAYVARRPVPVSPSAEN